MSEILITSPSIDGIVSLTLNRPEVHNAFNEDLIAALTAEFTRLNDDANVRAIIVQGAGKSFCAGGDLDWMRRAAHYSSEENYQDAMRLARLMQAIDRNAKLTIALVQGAAYGGGVGLAACCDIVIADERAHFCLSEVKIGLMPAAIAPYVLRAIGSRQARRYCQTAEKISAQTALQIGLVHEVVSDITARLGELLNHLRLNAPQAQQAAKQILADLADAPLDEASLELTAQRIAERRASAEGREGLSAFLEKRTANWVKQ